MYSSYLNYQKQQREKGTLDIIPLLQFISIFQSFQPFCTATYHQRHGFLMSFFFITNCVRTVRSKLEHTFVLMIPIAPSTWSFPCNKSTDLNCKHHFLCLTAFCLFSFLVLCVWQAWECVWHTNSHYTRLLFIFSYTYTCTLYKPYLMLLCRAQRTHLTNTSVRRNKSTNQQIELQPFLRALCFLSRCWWRCAVRGARCSVLVDALARMDR